MSDLLTPGTTDAAVTDQAPAETDTTPVTTDQRELAVVLRALCGVLATLTLTPCVAIILSAVHWLATTPKATPVDAITYFLLALVVLGFYGAVAGKLFNYVNEPSGTTATEVSRRINDMGGWLGGSGGMLIVFWMLFCLIAFTPHR